MIDCEKKRANKKGFARASFRWGEWRECKHGLCRQLFACPVGQWMPRKKVCRGDMRVYASITSTRARKCPKGYRRKP
jgi:hypothetical protein